ncbi:MAG: hypothetical protein M1831_001548 [Alyxoria varia]|nr:MAG: hypothetical protein M1831_001548 [Alyxoria varia]
MFLAARMRCLRGTASPSWTLLIFQYFLLTTTTSAQVVNNPGSKFTRPAPWDYSNVNNYTSNPTWLIGSTVHISWENVALREYNITLLQQDPYQGGDGSNVAQRPIYTKNATDPEIGPEGINWTVTTYGLDEEISSNIYYLSLAGPTAPADLWTTWGILSHYINFTTNADNPAVTDPPPGLASKTPSPKLNTYLSPSEQQKSGGNASGSGSGSGSSSDDSTSDRARDIGLGVGLGIGIPLLLLALLAGWLALQLKKSRSTIKLQEENGYGASAGGTNSGGWYNGGATQGRYRQELGSGMETKELPDDAVRRAEMGVEGKVGAGGVPGVPELPAGRESALVEGQGQGQGQGQEQEGQGVGGLRPGNSQRSWSRSERG